MKERWHTVETRKENLIELEKSREIDSDDERDDDAVKIESKVDPSSPEDHSEEPGKDIDNESKSKS